MNNKECSTQSQEPLVLISGAVRWRALGWDLGSTEWVWCLPASVTCCRSSEQPRARMELDEKPRGESLRLRVSILWNRNPLSTLFQNAKADYSKQQNQQFLACCLVIWYKRRKVAEGCEEGVSLQRMIAKYEARSVPRELIWRACRPGCRATSLHPYVSEAEWVNYMIHIDVLFGVWLGFTFYSNVPFFLQGETGQHSFLLIYSRRFHLSDQWFMAEVANRSAMCETCMGHLGISCFSST